VTVGATGVVHSGHSDVDEGGGGGAELVATGAGVVHSGHSDV